MVESLSPGPLSKGPLDRVRELSQIAKEGRAWKYEPRLAESGTPKERGRASQLITSRQAGEKVLQEWVSQIDWEGVRESIVTELKQRRSGAVVGGEDVIQSALQLIRSAYGDKPPSDLVSVVSELEMLALSRHKMVEEPLQQKFLEKYPGCSGLPTFLDQLHQEKSEVVNELFGVLETTDFNALEKVSNPKAIASWLERMAPFYTAAGPLWELRRGIERLNAQTLPQTGFEKEDLQLIRRLGGVAPDRFQCWRAAFKILPSVVNHNGLVPTKDREVRDLIFLAALGGVQQMDATQRALTKQEAGGKGDQELYQRQLVKTMGSTTQLERDAARPGIEVTLAGGPTLSYPMAVADIRREMTLWVGDQWLPGALALATQALAVQAPDALMHPGAAGGFEFMGDYGPERRGTVQIAIQREMEGESLTALTAQYRVPVDYVRYRWEGDKRTVEAVLQRIETVLKVRVTRHEGTFRVQLLSEEVHTVAVKETSVAGDAGAVRDSSATESKTQ
jgi:hypothetical protein